MSVTDSAEIASGSISEHEVVSCLFFMSRHTDIYLMGKTDKNYALLLLQRMDGKVLFQLRTDNAPTFPSLWGFFGGAIEDGESPETAVRREAREELSYHCQNARLILHLDRDDLDHPFGGARYFFLESYDETQCLNLQEGKGMGWFTFEQATELTTPPHNLEILPRLSSLLQ